MKFNALLTNAVIFHNALDIAEIVRQLLEEGWEIAPEDLAHISPYLTEHINRFGEYSTHELGIQPDAYDPKLDVDFTPLREQDLSAVGLGQAARPIAPRGSDRIRLNPAASWASGSPRSAPGSVPTGTGTPRCDPCHSGRLNLLSWADHSSGRYRRAWSDKGCRSTSGRCNTTNFPMNWCTCTRS